MEQENLYIRLFKPLRKSEEEEIYTIWMKNIKEEIYYKKEAIKEYCDSDNYDYLMALNFILKKIRNKYLVELAYKYDMQFLDGFENDFPYYDFNDIQKLYPYYPDFYYETKAEIKLRLRNQIIKSYGSISDESSFRIDEVMESIDKNGYAIYNTNDFNIVVDSIDYGTNTIKRKEVLDDIKEIEFDIRNTFITRNHKPFIDDSLNTPCSVNMEELSEIDRLFYIPYNQLKNQILIKEEISDDLTNDNRVIEKELENIKQPETIVISEPAIKEDEKEKIKQSEELDENIEKVAKENNNSDKYDYNDIANKLNEFIENQLPETYKTVIVEGKLPNGFKPLRFRKENKRNIYRFMDCFNRGQLKNSKTIFGIEVKCNSKSDNNIDDFSKILKEINPEYRMKTEEYKKNKNNK